MDKTYDHKQFEEKIYHLWEKSEAFKAKKTGKPYTILMPPPNANASLHAGHAMYVVDDILVRWKRMQGFSALWLPGTDHAGFETQYVYEKELAKKNQSRMDFDRETLYQNIFNFVKENSGLIFEQFKKLGFSADWDRSVFTLDKDVLDRVFETFKKMESEGLVYRDSYMVNYCTDCGTSIAELEVKHEEREDPLYFIKYRLVGKGDKCITVATVRPETIFGDTAVAINPKDKRYKGFVGLTAYLPLINREVPIIEDNLVDISFGTGALKITPAHDPTDFEIGKRHGLEAIPVIDLNGRMKMPKGFSYPEIEGKKVKIAREEVVKRLQKEGFIEKIDENYLHAVTICYKCGKDLEPTIMPNWFIKVKDLKKPVIEAVKTNKVKFFPNRFKKHMLAWLDIMHDWPISRQIVWGIRIPAWYDIDENPNLEVSFIDKKGVQHSGNLKTILKTGNFTFEEVEKGLQNLIVPEPSKYTIGKEKPGGRYLQDTDTFDTWFSSGQWPLVTLKGDEFTTRFPTDTMGTLSDILKFWISRMIMFSLYLKGKVPFRDIYLWSMVADAKGVKMSKSKGNVINPIDLVEKYGADALRMSLMYGTPAGSKVILSEDKVRAMRNFANKVWNVARFILANKPANKAKSQDKDDNWILRELNLTIEKTTQALDKYNLNLAAEEIYDFIWHKFADIYIEKAKLRRAEAQGTLEFVLQESLKLLHPFMPFVTETIWQEGKERFDSPILILSSWPK